MRPEGWNVPLEISPLGTTGYHKIDKLSFEAGADAMLEGLRKGLGCCDYHSTKESHYGRKGYFVFIPEGNK